MKKILSALVCFLCIFIFSNVLATSLKSDPQKSSISATFKQLGVPIDLKFKRFTTNINFDEKKLSTSKASIDIDIQSADLGDAQYNKEVLKKEWFNAAAFPKASFTSTSITATAPNKFAVTGTLSIKGKSTPVRFFLTTKTQGTQKIFEGDLPIQRLTYKIGEGEWADTSMVEDTVVIHFHLYTTP